MIPLGILALSGAVGGGSYELIESQVLSSSASSVTFSSIPQDYKHLQIRAVARDNRSNTSSLSYFRLNGATTGYGLGHVLYGDGSSVTSTQDGASSYIDTFYTFTGSTAPTGSFGVAVVDILDYANTSKNTTTRALTGYMNTAGQINLKSGLWINTAAVTQIDMISTTSFVSGSRFSLYGIRG